MKNTSNKEREKEREYESGATTGTNAKLSQFKSSVLAHTILEPLGKII